ncbi:MAG: hypothetical protein JXA21_00125 [Anaerolineae bacterium]|nr:hypothetical protein [Anaerolineae bacterium]
MHSLFDAVCEPRNLRAAWQKVRGSKIGAARRRSAGSDGVTVADWDANAEARLRALQDALQLGHYRPAPLLWFEVPRHTPRHSVVSRDRSVQEFRQLGIPTVTDRVTQRAVLNVLEPLWETVFLPCSHGYRSGHSVFTAVEHILRHHAQGLTWILNADIADYFNTVQHTVLLEMLGPLGDQPLLNLISLWLAAEGADNAAARPGRGLAQGAVLSPLLANIYLHPFDTAMLEAGWAMVRYADDFVILTIDLAQAQQALVEAANTLAELGLALNSEKTTIVEFGPDFEFLGARFCE